MWMVNPSLARIIPVAAPPSSERWTFADLADLFADAPLVIHARIASATPVPGQAKGPPATRMYVEGEVVALIRGTQALPPRVTWLVDVVPDSRGKLPKLNKTDVMLAALPVTGKPAAIQLAARDAQVPWSQTFEARVRSLVSASASVDTPPRVTGVNSAFHSDGTVPGEGETQIFLSTATGIPITLTILARPGVAKTWAFAVGEIVDEAAAPPVHDTLAWYRLACFLPGSVPGAATSELAPGDAEAVRMDYAFVIKSAGPCTRTRTVSGQ